MSFETIIGFIFAILAILYLMYALLRPEKL